MLSALGSHGANDLKKKAFLGLAVESPRGSRDLAGPERDTSRPGIDTQVTTKKAAPSSSPAPRGCSQLVLRLTRGKERMAKELLGVAWACKPGEIC